MSVVVTMQFLTVARSAYPTIPPTAAVMELTTILPSNQQSVTVKLPSNLAPTIPPIVSDGHLAGSGPG